MPSHLDGFGDGRAAWRQVELPATGQAAGLARQLTRETLAAWRRADLEETAVLIVSELVTNAVRHASIGGSLVALRLEIDGTSVRIEVHDEDPRWPSRLSPMRWTSRGSGSYWSAPWPASGA